MASLGFLPFWALFGPSPKVTLSSDGTAANKQLLRGVIKRGHDPLLNAGVRRGSAPSPPPVF